MSSSETESLAFHPHTGKLPAYYDGDCFEEYLLQIEFYFEANRIKTEADKRATLLTCIGKKVFSKLRNVLHPKSLKDVSYDDIVKELKSHFSPQTSVIMERFRFHNMKQTMEDIAAFIVKIKEQATNFVLPVWTYEVRLVTSPAADSIYVPAGKPFNVTCRGSGGSDGKFSSMKWLNTEGDVIPDGVPGVQKEGSNVLSLIFTNPKVEESGVYKCVAVYDVTHSLEKLVKITFFENETSSIVNVEVLNVTSNSVLFNIETSAPVSFIEVKYNEARDSTEYTKKWNAGDDYEVTDLIPGGLYSFRFRTEEDDDWSDAYKVALLPGRPDVIFRNLENGNVKIEWLRNFDDYMRGTIDKYELTYFTVQLEKGTTWVPSNCAITIQIPFCGGLSYTISGLQKDVYYEIQLRIHTSSGYGEPYRQKIFFPK